MTNNDKMGYAYECLICKECKGEKRYVKAHVYNKQLRPTFSAKYVTLRRE